MVPDKRLSVNHLLALFVGARGKITVAPGFIVLGLSAIKKRGIRVITHLKNRSVFGMENRRSLNSPRRILSFSRNRRAKVLFQDPDGEPKPGDRDGGGPKPDEVYGFVGSITTVVALVVFLVWAYVPEYWLHTVGIYYYPSRYWAIAAPTYAMVTLVLVIGFYIGINFMVTPPPTSFNTIFNEYTRNPVSLVPSTNEDEPPIPPMFDITINQINDAMFSDPK